MITLAGVSVIVCCYNSISRIDKTLLALSRQNITAGFKCEIVVVDNCSTDGTSGYIETLWQTMQVAGIGFRIVQEGKPGLNHAREKGITEAIYSYLVFCDDDNLLAPDYVQNVKRLFDENETFGVIGGNNYYLNNFKNFVTEHFIQDYAIGEQARNEQLEDITNSRGFVWGAGMCFRKEIFLELKRRNFKTLLTDRKGKELSSGGDAEFCLAVRLLNWKVGVSSALKLVHNIPDERFHFDYLLRLKKGFGRAQPFLSIYDSLWSYKNGTPLPYSYRRELKHCFQSLLNKKKAVYHYVTGQKKKNTTYVELYVYFSQIGTLLSQRSKLDQLFHSLCANYDIDTP